MCPWPLVDREIRPVGTLCIFQVLLQLHTMPHSLIRNHTDFLRRDMKGNATACYKWKANSDLLHRITISKETKKQKIRPWWRSLHWLTLPGFYKNDVNSRQKSLGQSSIIVRRPDLMITWPISGVRHHLCCPDVYYRNSMTLIGWIDQGYSNKTFHNFKLMFSKPSQKQNKKNLPFLTKVHFSSPMFSLPFPFSSALPVIGSANWSIASLMRTSYQ